MRRRALALYACGLATWLGAGVATAGPVDQAKESELGESELAAAEAAASARDRVHHARAAAAHFEESARATGEWLPAARASDAYALAEMAPLASAWYWIAADAADYSEDYLAWQKRSLEQIFAKRASVTFHFSEPAKTVRVDGWSLPYDAFGRPVAFDEGSHTVSAMAERGKTYEGSLVVASSDLKRAKFFSVSFPEASDDTSGIPADKKYPPRPNEGGFSALQIVTIVATTALATGIAIGGGYLLFGSDNPHGLDSPEGAAIVVTEVVLIGGGVTIAIISD